MSVGSQPNETYDFDWESLTTFGTVPTKMSLAVAFLNAIHEIFLGYPHHNRRYTR